MKYMLFAWYERKACGGLNDLVKWSNSIEELEKYFYKQYEDFHYTHGQIVNATSLQVEKEL